MQGRGGADVKWTKERPSNVSTGVSQAFADRAAQPACEALLILRFGGGRLAAAATNIDAV